MALIGLDGKGYDIIKRGNPLSQSEGDFNLEKILKYISDIFNSPLAQMLIQKVNPQGSIDTVSESKTLPVPAQPNPTMILNYLKTPQGKKMLVDGLRTIQHSAGDMKLSQIITFLEGGSGEKQ